MWGLASLLGVCPWQTAQLSAIGGHAAYIQMLAPLVIQSFQKVPTTVPELSDTSLWLLAQISHSLTDYSNQLEKGTYQICNTLVFIICTCPCSA